MGPIRSYSIAISVLRRLSNAVQRLDCDIGSDSDETTWLRPVPIKPLFAGKEIRVREGKENKGL